jgi:hypothetical protein
MIDAVICPFVGSSKRIDAMPMAIRMAIFSIKNVVMMMWGMSIPRMLAMIARTGPSKKMSDSRAVLLMGLL